jgi:hypothetical protein
MKNYYILNMIKMNFSYGIFTGTRRIDAIIMSYIDDSDLCRLFQTSKYFNSFNNYDYLFKLKIINLVGLGHLKNIESNFKNRYIEFINNATLYTIPEELYLCIIKKKQAFIIAKEYCIKNQYNIRHGDIIRFEKSKYESDRILLYDYNKLRRLDYSLNGKGVIPSCFHILTSNKGTIFPAKYWKKYINSELWLKLEDIKPLIYHLVLEETEENMLETKIKTYIMYAQFTINERNYYIIYSGLKKITSLNNHKAMEKFKTIETYKLFPINYTDNNLYGLNGIIFNYNMYL